MGKDETYSEIPNAGATFLSKQETRPTNYTDTPDLNWQKERSHYETRLVMLRNWRESWWVQNWSDLTEFILPRRSIWLTQSTGGFPNPNSMTRGLEINTAILDSTGTLAVRVCASGLMSGLASPSRPWFKIVPSNRKMLLDATARMYLDEVEDRMYTVIAGSNFYNSFAQECEDLVVFGTAPNIIYEDVEDLVRLYNPAVGEYYLSTNATMRIDGLFRLFVMTVSQIVGYFGIENCTKEIQALWNEKGAALEMERMIAHCIEPNYEIAANGVGKIPGNFTWREVYWVWGQASDRPLSKRGFIDQPFTAARWSTQSNDAYGRSPGMDVLPDVMQLQVMTKRMAEAIEKLVRPPLIGSMELKNKPTSTLPGHLTYVSDLGPGKGIRPIYEVNPDVGAMEANIKAIEQRVQVGFFNDLFLMLEQMKGSDRMTAYEVAQKLQEKLQVLGPVIESLIGESLKPKLKRIFNILKRKNMLPPLPDSLQEIPLDIEFVSMLALAQKAAATGGIERLLQLVGAASTVFPQARDNIDIDSTIREYNELLGNPQKVLHGPQEVQQVRVLQQKQVAQQQQAQGMSQMAEAAGKAAPMAGVLADMKLGQQGPIAQALGGPSGMQQGGNT